MAGVGFFELFAGVLAALFAFVRSYGVAIVLLTVVVRILLLPLSIKQTRSMREMQRIAPEVKRIQAKHKGDRQKMNEEVMALYREHGVNPLGGCLPLLLQMPVFIALYQVLLKPLDYLKPFDDTLLENQLRTAPEAVNAFLGMRLDATPSGVLSDGGLLSALPYLLLVALMGYTTYFQSKQMQGATPASDVAAQQQRMMTTIMPVMLMVFSFTFPAGLTMYWLTSNVWTIGQQRLMTRAIPPVAPAGDAKTKTPKASSRPDTGKPPKKTPAKPGSEQRQDSTRSQTTSKKSGSSKKKKRR